MTGKTHDVVAFTALLLVLLNSGPLPEMSLATAVVAFGANFIGGLFPDIDQPTSDFWDNFRLGPFIAKVVCPALGGHRHISHSLIGLAIIGWGSQAILNALASTILIDMHLVWLAFMIGVASHFLADSITKEGLPLLWPFQWNFGIPPLKFFRITSGKFVEEKLIFPSLILLNLYLIWQNFTLLQHFVLELFQ